MIPKKLRDKAIERFEGNAIQADLWFRAPSKSLRGMKPKDLLIKPNGYKILDTLIEEIKE